MKAESCSSAEEGHNRLTLSCTTCGKTFDCVGGLAGHSQHCAATRARECKRKSTGSTWQQERQNSKKMKMQPSQQRLRRKELTDRVRHASPCVFSQGFLVYCCAALQCVSLVDTSSLPFDALAAYS